jgi:hypothetical protein
MPPKKKDKKKERKPRKKKVIKLMTQPSLPKLPTGFNRDLPFGAGGGGSGNLISAIASRPPTQPFQTPDQLGVIQDTRKAADLLKEVVIEQARVRKERSDKGIKRGPRGTKVVIGQQVAKGGGGKMPTEPPPALAAVAAGGATVSQPPVEETVQPEVSASIRKVGRPKKSQSQQTQEYIMTPPPTPPPNYLGDDSMLRPRPTTEGGAAPQQGIYMGNGFKLTSRSGADFSHSLVGASPIGDYDGFV